MKDAIARAVKGRYTYERIQRAQFQGADGSDWAVATAVPYPSGPTQLVVLEREAATWHAVPCATVPKAVVRSLLLRCDG